jgi:ribosomal protein S18 acetylase RimI-like enzyme
MPIWTEILEKGTTLIAVRNQETVGFLSTGPARDTDLKDAGYGELYALYVDPARWRSGVGTELWRAGLGWFSGQEYREVSLWVLEANRIARNFYQKLDFAHDGHTERYQAGDRRLVERRYVRGL